MKAESYQKLIRRDERIRKTVGITRFFEFFELFPLDGADGLGSQIQQDTVDTFHLVSDPVGDLVQDLVGDLFDGSAHSVLGVDSADDSGPAFVAALVTDTNALDVGNSNEVLPYLLSQAALIELITQDSVCLAQSFQTVAGDGTQAADTPAGAGKG